METPITRLQASIPRPPMIDGYVWVDMSEGNQILFVSQQIDDPEYTARWAGYSHHAAFDGDEKLAAKVDKAVEAYRRSLAEADSTINIEDAERLEQRIANTEAMNARLVAENQELRAAIAALKAAAAAPPPRLQPDDVPAEVGAQSMDDLALPGVKQQPDDPGDGVTGDPIPESPKDHTSRRGRR